MQDRKKLSLKNLPDVFMILKIMLISGILFIISLSLINSTKETTLIFYAIGNAMLIAGAFFGAGGLTGFLFGIPKILQNNNVITNTTVTNNTDVIHNDNLVQISDWLTKIIVGVGLTQLYNIPYFLYSVGKKLGTSILGYNPGINSDLGTNVSVAIILYFSVLGFMMVYIWTRIYFFQVLRQTENEYKILYNKTVLEKKKIENDLDNVTTEKNQLVQQNEITQEDLSALVSTFPDVTQTIKDNQIKIRNDETIESDPNKGKFGRLSVNNERKLSAKIRETSYDDELFVIDLEVSSTNPDKNPLEGDVTFYLHPSFPNEIEKIKVTNGKAENKLISYGTFTVGVVCDSGKTKLELDLAEVPDAPKLFKER